MSLSFMRLNCSLTVEFALIQEYILLQNERIEQIYVIQSEQNPFLWFGVLFVEAGIYAGCVIRFTMVIDSSYPNCACPTITFDPIPPHPLVDPETGMLDTKWAFPDWNSDTHKLHQLVLFTKRIIFMADYYIKQVQDVIKITTDTNNMDPALSNEILATRFSRHETTIDITRMYECEPENFFHQVHEFKRLCDNSVYERSGPWSNDNNAITFSPWNPDIHEPLRNCILAGQFAPPSLFASYNKQTDSVSFVPGSDRQ